MKSLAQHIRKNSIVIVIGLILALLIVTAGAIFRNKTIILKNNVAMQEADLITNTTSQLIHELLHNFDLGIRAYAITKDDSLFAPALDAVKFLDARFIFLKKSLAEQHYDTEPVDELHNSFIGYKDFILEMKHQAEIDSMQTFKKMLKEDRGLKVFMIWSDIGMKIIDFENQRKVAANAEYESAVNNNLYLQLLTLLIGLPTLGYVIYKIRHDERERLSLMVELDENNRKYIFNPGTLHMLNDPKQVIENSIVNLQQASVFIENISTGKYAAEWNGLTQGNESLNQTNLAGRLTNMRDQLKQLKDEEERRLWTNEGLTKFSETVRNHQTSLADLSNEVIRFITRYLGAQQGGLFIVRQHENESYLELAACFAYDRKKFIEKRIEIGVGLIGQTYLEGQTTFLTKLPQGYTYITSGMGETTPGCLLIVPMKYNTKTEAIIEIASLEKFQDYQIAFLEKAGEFVASALQSARTTERMQDLLVASQRQTEEMRATEEELRQNLEELQATQEAMFRKQQMHDEEMKRTVVVVEKLKAAEEEIIRLKATRSESIF
jgi:hypothetical protein